LHLESRSDSEGRLRLNQPGRVPDYRKDEMNSNTGFQTAITSVTKFPWKAAFFLCAANLAATAQQHAIDTAKSTMTVRVYKAGVFSAFGHNHEIAAPIARGTADTSAHQVELYVNATALQVRDPDTSGKDRAEIQNTMLGPEVLDATNQPEIAFRSTAVEPMGTGAWKVNGNLTLHGQTHPISVEVREENGHYLGNSLLKQTDFGIKPVKVAGGSIRVKDEIRIEFDIQLAR
jgi:polyisoprenoid-binding protein YceI